MLTLFKSNALPKSLTGLQTTLGPLANSVQPPEIRLAAVPLIGQSNKGAPLAFSWARAFNLSVMLNVLVSTTPSGGGLCA